MTDELIEKCENTNASTGLNFEQLKNNQWLALALADIVLIQCRGKLKKSSLLKSWGLGILGNLYKEAEEVAEQRQIEMEYKQLLAKIQKKKAEQKEQEQKN